VDVMDRSLDEHIEQARQSIPDVTDLLRIHKTHLLKTFKLINKQDPSQSDSYPVADFTIPFSILQSVVDSTTGEWSKIDSYICTRMIDASRSFDGSESGSFNFVDCINSYTLSREMTNAVNRISFFSKMNDLNKNDHRAQFLSKGLNKKCNLRMIGGTTQSKCFKYMTMRIKYDKAKKSKLESMSTRKGRRSKHIPSYVKIIDSYENDMAACNDIQDTVMCSILGNFIHSQTRLKTSVRILLMKHRKTFSWFQPLMHLCPMILLWCSRDFIVHALSQSPGMKAQIGKIMNWETFSDLTENAMCIIRTYFNRDGDVPFTSLGKALLNVNGNPYCKCEPQKAKSKGTCLFLSQPWLVELNDLLKPLAFKMNTINFSTPDSTFYNFILGANMKTKDDLKTGNLRLTKRPIPSHEERRSLLELAKEEECDSDTDDFKSHLKLGGKIRKSFETRIKVANKERQAIAVIQDNINKEYIEYLTPIQYNELSSVCEKCVLANKSFLDVIDQWFCYFGVKRETVDTIIRMYEDHRDKKGTKTSRAMNAWKLRAREPHAYNILHFAAALYKRSKKSHPAITCVFPVNTLVAQIMAHRRKWIQNPGDEVEDSSVCIFFCSICNKVYSNVRRHALKKSTKNQYAEYGLVKAWYDTQTDNFYCRFDKQNHNGKCFDTPLVRVNLLGIRFRLGRDVYQICVRCSAIMVPNAQLGKDWQGKGEICSHCCKEYIPDAIRIPLTAAYKRFKPINPPTKVEYNGKVAWAKCAHCKGIIWTMKSAYIYPCDVIICSHCNKPPIIHALSKKVASSELSSPEKVIQLIAKAWSEKKRKNLVRSVRKQKSKMLKMKRHNRNKRA